MSRLWTSILFRPWQLNDTSLEIAEKTEAMDVQSSPVFVAPEMTKIQMEKKSEWKPILNKHQNLYPLIVTT